MDREPIRVRFQAVLEYVINNNIVKDAKEFAEKIEVSSSSMTEINKGRTSPGISIIQKTVKEFGINAKWLLLGEGDMFKERAYIEDRISVLEEYYKELATIKRELTEIKQTVGSIDPKYVQAFTSKDVSSVKNKTEKRD